MRPLLACAALVLLFAATPARAETYGVFCAGGRIEIDAREADEMQRQRGACQFARFGSRSDAENFARRNFGGVGSSCSCR